MANENTTLTLKKQSDATWSNETVSIASKLPMPFVMQLHHKVKRTVQAHGGTSTIEVFEPVIGTKSKPSSFTIAGNSYIKRPGDAVGVINSGYAITTGIPKEFWDDWVSLYHSHDAIQNNMIFAHKESASIISMAKEHEGEKSGMERLDPKNLPKVGAKIETSDHFRGA